MRLFSKLYNKAISWSRHPHAPYYLCGVSFIESSVFPIPPDVMLAPMALARPDKAWRYAALTTISSVFGALFGYILGRFFFGWISPMLTHMGYMADYQLVQTWFQTWGGWILFIAAISPIPFKVFTIAGGALHIALLPFIVGSLVGRGIRFFLVAGLMRWGGERMELWLKRTVDVLGWTVVALLLVGYSVYRWIV